MKEWVQLSTETAPAIGATIEKIPEERTETPVGGFATRLDELGICTGRIIQVGAHWANQPEGRSGYWVLVEYDTPDYSRFCERYGHAEGSPESLREYREYAANRAILDGLAASRETDMPVTVAMLNPWSGATVTRDVTGLSQETLDGWMNAEDRDMLERVTDAVPDATPGEWLAEYVRQVGPEHAGRVIIGG